MRPQDDHPLPPEHVRPLGHDLPYIVIDGVPILQEES